MPPPDEIRIQHLVEAAQKAIAYTENRSREDLDINLDVLWSTVTDDLPGLLAALGKSGTTDS